MARMSALGKEAGKQGRTALEIIILWALLFTLALGIWEALSAGARLIRSSLKTPHPRVMVDVWSGKNKPDGPLKTVAYVEFRPVDLVFQQKGDGFQAAYELELGLYNQQKQLVATRIAQGAIFTPRYEETQNPDQFRIREFAFQGLPEGKYRGVLLFTDRTIQKTAMFEIPVEVSLAQSTGLAISQILLARKAEVIALREEEKSQSGIIPYPAALYGSEQPELYFYFEIYHPERQGLRHGKADSVHYRVSYITPDNQQVSLFERKQKLFAPRVPVFNWFDTAELAPGQYRLMIEVASLDGRFNLVSEKNFTVYQSPLDLRFRSYQAVLRELELVGRGDEIKQLKKLPPEHRQQGIMDFWKRRDPTPETPENEVMIEFYRRMEIARRQFWIGSQEKGWLSDQGMVFVLYGTPDRVVRRRDPVNHISLEIWHYTRLKVQAVFLDQYGFGDYRLVQPYSLLQR